MANKNNDVYFKTGKRSLEVTYLDDCFEFECDDNTETTRVYIDFEQAKELIEFIQTKLDAKE